MVVHGWHSDPGERYGGELNQDAWFVYSESEWTAAGVLDGHGMLGDHASNIGARSFERQFNQIDLDVNARTTEELETIVCDMFKTAHHEILESYNNRKQRISFVFSKVSKFNKFGRL